jgi:hypothetical protein
LRNIAYTGGTIIPHTEIARGFGGYLIS